MDEVAKILREETEDICLWNYAERIKNVLRRTKPYILANKNLLDVFRDSFYEYLFDIYEEAYRDKELWDKSFDKLVKEVYSPTFLEIDKEVIDDDKVETNNTTRSNT